MPADSQLREEVSLLGEILGQTIELMAGSESLQLVEELRRLAWERRNKPAETKSDLAELIAGLDHDQIRVVIRAFTIFLDLANLAEDRQRIRVLREREQAAFPEAYSESIRAAFETLKGNGASVSEMHKLMDALEIELVFTSHPTEAKRRSVRRKLRRIRKLLYESDYEQVPSEQEHTKRSMRAELAKLWQTDFIRPWRPSVMQEVQRGLSIKPVLWDVIPRLLKDFRSSMDKVFDEKAHLTSPCLRFGSWIGGDRDGHPDVNHQVTEQTAVWLRSVAIEFHLKASSDLFESLSLSQRQVEFGPELNSGINAASQHWPQIESELASIPPNEMCRRWIRIIHWRLRQTEQVTLDDWNIVGAYRFSSELSQNVSTLLDAVSKSPAADLLVDEVQQWLDRIDTFGLHLARLDVRQDARQYRTVINELLKAAGLCESSESLEESARVTLLAETLNKKLHIPSHKLSKQAIEVIDLFRLLHRIHQGFGRHALGGHVISMTHAPSDVISVLWLWEQTESGSLVLENEESVTLPIIPLFETIDDLQRGPEILDAIFNVPAYRDFVRRQHDRQTVMLGYSDSTKDGGYIAACWSLYEAQQKLERVAEGHGIQLTFFHGRGGSLGRGGGPTARSIRSLPAGTFNGSLRLTEQGEVLADRYDDPRIAHRHLEQLIWSSLLACGQPICVEEEAWTRLMQRLSNSSFTAYRALVEQPGFVDFFRSVTPIAEVEQLPIGSRPSRRTGGSSLSDLRAIPWVFSWTQCRCLIPAWYGLGSAIEEILEEPNSEQLLQEMYRGWPFFRATIENAELALAKADLDIAEQYAELADISDTHVHVKQMVTAEFRRTLNALSMITGADELLDGTPWLKESIRVRNRYIDPLNLIQVELLSRLRKCPEENQEEYEELQHLTRLTINGIAAGMRTSG
jgi:phosphoenolpyruvate carboxylase